MYSVIIPTMWKCARFNLGYTINELCKHPLVGEVIIIDNTDRVDEIKVDPKIKHILEGKNTYVNPAWNKGVELAKYDKLLILNDDIWMDWKILDILEPYITPQNGLIGLDEQEYNIEHTGHEFGLEPISHRNGGFGCAMFLHKENYTPIPNEMKIWGGDDWLFVKNRNRRKQNYKLVGYTIYGDISTTSDSVELGPIKKNDLMLKDYYKLF